MEKFDNLCSSSVIFCERKNINSTKDELDKPNENSEQPIPNVKSCRLNFAIVAQARVRPNVLDAQLRSLHTKK